MDKLPKELGDAVRQFRLYPAHVAGVPLRPGLSPSYAAHDRIIYDIYDDRVTVLVVKAEEHYNDK